ncbi:MAG: hypothetical protein KHX46_07010 [Clostridiales bacterium]|nr:hypothetical protein [Clostridiales bacterium]
MKGRRWAAAFGALLCGLLFLLPAQAAEVREKTYALESAGTKTAFRADREEAAFWEYPQLVPGQTLTGQLTLVNRTGETSAVSLDDVQLPYDDVEVLAYLNAVSLRVEKGDEVLYNGPYVRIADALPQLSTELAPGEGATLDITAWCQYGYDGDVAPGLITWDFAAEVSAPWETPDPAEPASWIFWVICAAVLIAVICGLLGLFLKRRARRKPANTDH